MMTIADQEAPLTPSTQEEGTGVGWFFSGLVLPFVSRRFYCIASGKSLGIAFLFFFFFTSLMTIASTLQISRSFSEMQVELERAIESNQIPTITISNGIASVDAAQPFIILDQSRELVALDTSGRIERIDRNRYDQGILLTRTEIHALNERGEYQVISLSDLNAMFRDPLVVNEETILSTWGLIAGFLRVIVLIGLGLWNFVARLILVVMLGLLLWGITTLIRPGTQFNQILITGIYAFVPAIYLDVILSRIGLNFFLMQTLIFVALWVVAIIFVLQEVNPVDIRTWRRNRLNDSLLAIPFLILLFVDAIYSPDWGQWVLPGLGFATFLSLVWLETRLEASLKVDEGIDPESGDIGAEV
jgi:hypothetical protein